MLKIILEFESCQEVNLLGGKEYHIVVSIAKLIAANGSAESWISWKLPLAANVRRPAKNKVTQSILKSLREGNVVISSPLHIVSISSKIDHFCKRLTLDFNSNLDYTQGILDGAHRLLSFILAHYEGVNLTESFCSLVIYSGYSEEYLKSKAVALNNSMNVDSVSLSHYSGLLDNFKSELDNYRIIYYKNQFGSAIAQTPQTDGLCTINHIMRLLLCLDSSYPKNDGTRHPTYLTSSSNFATREYFQKKLKALFPLVHDVLWLQEELCNLVDAKFRSEQFQPFMVATNDSRRCTKLPTNTTLSGILRKSQFIYPILSALRPYILYKQEVINGNNSYYYISNLPHKNRLKQHLKQLLSQYLEIVKQVKYQTMIDTSINKDTFIWEKLYTSVEKHVNKDKAA